MFNFRGFNAERQHDGVYPTASAPAFFDYTNFSDMTMEGGPVDMRDAIHRELEKEMIREKIIAEEIECYNVLEAEVRRELMIGREMMAMKSSRGLPSSFMLGLQPGEIKETTASLLDAGTGNPYGPTLTQAKLKPPPPLLPTPGGSTKLNSSGSKKMEWRCSICKISATCERGLQDHLAGRKHQAKVAALRADNTEKAIKSVETREAWVIKNSPVCVPNDTKEDKKKPSPPSLPAVAGSMELPKKKMEWRCPICNICSTSEIDLHNHFAGKKHKAKAAIIREGKNV